MLSTRNWRSAAIASCATPKPQHLCAQPAAGERVMASIEQSLVKRLKLKVNTAKSAVAKTIPERAEASASLHDGRAGVARQTIDRFKASVLEMTCRTRGRRKSRRSCRAISSDGAGYFGSCELRRCCANSTSGSGDGCAPSPGSNGSADARASQTATPRRRPGSGGDNRWQLTWPLAAQQQPRADPCPAERLPPRTAPPRNRGAKHAAQSATEPPYTDS